MEVQCNKQYVFAIIRVSSQEIVNNTLITYLMYANHCALSRTKCLLYFREVV